MPHPLHTLQTARRVPAIVAPGAVAPNGLAARARGAGNAGGVNAELPAGWAPTRTRTLCAWPAVSRCKGSGSLDDATNFNCTR